MFRLFALCALVFACAVHSEAQTPFERDKVPAQLREWIPWIEARHPEWSCVGDPADAICRFAGKVSITRSNGVATFSAAVELLATSSVPLPGSADLPPTKVRIIRSDGTALSTPLASSESMMSVHLPSGSYTVTGELRWEGDRKDFPVPDEYAFVAFTDRTVGTLRRRSGSVWLEEQQTANVDDALSITVMRRITDRSPLLVESLMVLRVSGSSRSAELGVILPAGLRPIDISTTLPHQLTANGALALQLSPGVHEVRISAVGAQPVESLAVPKVAFEGWPGDETWAWVADPSFRSVDVSGAEAVSAAMTSLPPEWHSGAIYRVQAGDSLTLKELQRGEVRAAENALSLDRTLWLDLDGRAYSVADTFSGTMNQGFRLDALNELSVGRATVDGEPAFISRSPTGDANGIELRSQGVNMAAISRLARESSLSASGWSATFDNVSAELRLPPAWRLFHISNAEWVENSWVGSWTLLDLFVALLVVIGTAKLISRLAALALGLSLLVNHGEFLEPRMLLVHLLVGLTWIALAKDGSEFWRNSGRLFLGSTFAVWLLQILTFTKLQLTQFLFPQLQAGTRYRTALQELYLILEGSFLSWPAVAMLIVFGVMGLRWAFRGKSLIFSIVRLGLIGIVFSIASASVIGFFAMYSSQHARNNNSAVTQGRMNAFVDGRQPAPVSRAYDQNALLEVSSDSVEEFAASSAKSGEGSNAYQLKRQRRPVSKVVQSGPAEPTWTWKQHRFAFAGPVAPGHRASIYLLSPWMTSILSVIRVGLLFCLAAIFFRRAGYSLPSKMVPEIAIGLLLFLPTQSASAEFPGRELLAELESRMESERCRQATCASFDELEIRVQENMVRGVAKISATAPTVVTVPGPLDQLPISSIRLNGKETTSIRRSSTGFLQVLVPRGASRLEFDAQLLAQTVVTIQFPQLPVSVKAISDEWSIEGVSSTGSLAGNVRLIPKGEPGKTKTFQETVLPTWFIVTRSLELGETNSVETTVQRMGDTSTPASISVPVLDGERVTTGSVTSEGGVVTARFGIGTSTVSYTSSLASFADLKLVSKPSLQLSEVWTVECSPFVVCNVDGLSPTFSVTEGRSRSVWYPFPGDEV
ncbi:MAG: hypothetical protein IT290_02320, partial [Deltaproteobacteria bacterium]|nr:hypothetical protein [Deltaproteobacteria bacterium]